MNSLSSLANLYRPKRGRCLYCGRTYEVRPGSYINSGIRKHRDPRDRERICEGSGGRSLWDGEVPINERSD